MQQQLTGKVAIITGASRGLGEGIARAMAREGAVAVLFGRSIELLRKLEKELGAEGQKAAAFQVDVGRKEQVSQAVAEVLKRFGRVDILVNDAGIGPSMLFLDMPDSVRDDVMNVNFNGVWSCTRAVLPGMVERKYGKIINVSSVTGPMVSGKGMTAYAASKGAVSAFTRTLALEVARHGVTVNAICPGTFDTPMIRELAAARNNGDVEGYMIKAGKEIPLGRLGRMDEMGALAVFLASEGAAYITGQEIVIDGGNIIQEHK